MKKWWYWALGLLAMAAFYGLSAPERKEKKLKSQRDDLILDGSGRAKAKAFQKDIQADKLQADAVKAAKVGKEVVDNVGKNGESMRDMLDSWRKPDGV